MKSQGAPPLIKLTDIQVRFSELLTGLMGDGEARVSQIAPPDQAQTESLVFFSEFKKIENLFETPAQAVVVPLKAKSAIEALPPDQRLAKTFVFSKNVKLAMARVKAEYFTHEIPLQKPGTVHPSAVISPSARLGRNVSVGPYSVIGENAVIGDNVCIDASVIIEADCVIKNDSHLYSQLYIGPRTEIGARCILQPQSTIGAEGFGFAPDERGRFFRIPQTGRVVLEDDVEVGSQCTIDRATFAATRIGEGTKIDKQSHIAHNCQIGKHCILAGTFAVAGSARIGDHFIAGGRVTVKDGITIAAGVEIAGLSGVHNDIDRPGRYGGFPTQPLKEYIRTINTLAHLPRLRKQITQILKHLGLDDADAEPSRNGSAIAKEV